MAGWTGIGRVWKGALLLAVGVAGGGAALAVASVPDSNGEIHACVVTDDSGAPVTTGANLRIIDPSASQTCDTKPASGGLATEENLAWNTIGVPGRQGPRGLRGLRGAQGAQGKTATVVGGNTLTISGGNVITIGGNPTVAPPQITGNSRVVGSLSLGSGRSAQSSEIYSWSFGATNSHATGGGGGAGKSPVHEIIVTKTLDKASTSLMKACANGKHFPTVVLHVRKAGKDPQEYLTITMQNAVISSFSQSSGGDRPTESISLNFTKIEFKYSSQTK